MLASLFKNGRRCVNVTIFPHVKKLYLLHKYFLIVASTASVEEVVK